MSVYATIADCTDPVIHVEESDLEQADRMVTAILRNKGVTPADVIDADGLALLRDLAVAEASRVAATRGASDGETVLWRKVDEYRKAAQDLAQRINRESLGLAAAGSGAIGFSAIPLVRA